MTNAERVKLLGVDGARAFKNGNSDFLLSLRGFTNEIMGTRLKNVVTDVGNSGKISNKGGADVMLHSELAIVKDNGIKNDYRVNFELVNSKAYHDKFVGLTEHKALDEALYKQAAKMLEHRSGTEYEDIAMLDARTGKFIVGNDKASEDIKFKCGLRDEQIEKLNSSGKNFEILHNHPGSSIPSSDDIKWLFKRDKAMGSTIICHNGNIYSLRKIKALSNPDEVIDTVYNKIKEIYPSWSKEQVEYVTDKEIINRLEHSGHIKYIFK